MTDTTLPDKWSQSAKSIRAIQLAFEFSAGSVYESIRREANKNGLSTSDQIRKIIQLEVKPPLRPRLTVSLSEQDYQQLAQRYRLDANDKSAIREAIRNELIAFDENYPVEV